MDAPANSPHQRKSGSRAVVSVFGTFAPDSGSEESLLEDNEMKGVSTPLSTTAMNWLTQLSTTAMNWLTQLSTTAMNWLTTAMIWLKVFLILVCVVCFCKLSWASVTRMSVDLRDLFFYEAFLYYNPLLLVTIMVGLWGVNLWVFTQANADYANIFDLDQNHLTYGEIWKCAAWMGIIVLTSMIAYLYFYSNGEVLYAASQPVLLYVAFAMALIVPFDIFYWSTRYFLLRKLGRIVFPLQAITFADSFLADILTSMSKVFSDVERSVCRMAHQQVATIAWVESDSVCGSHSVAIPIVLVSPYLFRLFQCLRQYYDTRDRTTLFNALKYSTAVPVITLSALKYSVLPENWVNICQPSWVFFGVVNSLYSFYWDLTRDWDLSCSTSIFNFSSPHWLSYMFHGRKWVYYWVIGSNLILRCTWTYKLSAHLRHNYGTVFTITVLEIFRRFQWAFFRVEKEWDKQLNKGDMPEEEEVISATLNRTEHHNFCNIQIYLSEGKRKEM